MEIESVLTPASSISAPKTQSAAGVIYADIRGFTATMARIESMEAEARLKNMHLFVAAWARFRDALARPENRDFRSFYLANRVGDAFVILAFSPHVKLWRQYLQQHLLPSFNALAAAIRSIDDPSQPNPTAPYLKLSVYSTAQKQIPYFQTEPMSAEVLGGMKISQRDFFCTAVNRCARMDAWDEADSSTLLCNKAVRDFFIDEANLNPGAFIELGLRALRGFESETPERFFALMDL